MKRKWLPQVIISLMLLWALYPENPYGYYVLLRWATCSVFIYLTLNAINRDIGWLSWVLGITAFVYNPIFRIHLDREIWSVINILTVVLAMISIFKLNSCKKTPTT